MHCSRRQNVYLRALSRLSRRVLKLVSSLFNTEKATIASSKSNQIKSMHRRNVTCADTMTRGEVRWQTQVHELEYAGHASGFEFRPTASLRTIDRALRESPHLQRPPTPRTAPAPTHTADMRPILLSGHERALTQVKYNPDGDIIFSVSKDHVVCAWCQ